MADIKKTLGGDRIGAGKKMQVELDGYIRSNFDLSMVNRFSQAPGTIVPCYCNIGQKGDTWNFDLSALVRTKPTTGPLYGSFKFEILFFAADIRLYNGALHNNALNLGLNMQNVVYPKVKIPVVNTAPYDESAQTSYAWQIQSRNMNPSALMAYLGVTNPGNTGVTTNALGGRYRAFNGMPLLMYWDVVKNFFLNKQEENAWYIGVNYVNENGESTTIVRSPSTINNTTNSETIDFSKTTTSNAITIVPKTGAQNGYAWPIAQAGTATLTITFNEADSINIDNPGSVILNLNGSAGGFDYSLSEGTPNSGYPIKYTWNSNKRILTIKASGTYIAINSTLSQALSNGNLLVNSIRIQGATQTTQNMKLEGMALKPFPTSNLDKARGIVLKNFFEGENVTIDKQSAVSGPTLGIINFEPYSAVCEMATSPRFVPHNSLSQNGIAIKTYSNDIFNAFLNSETIQQINQQTAASITNGQLNISNLILAEKIYKLQNKIAVAGGTYEDWQEAVYGVPTAPANESPRFIGGMTSEIVFDEVVSSSATEINGEMSPLGALGGRGSLNGQKGGRFELEVKEDCIIMGLCCITPRIDYSQGNKWFFNLENHDQLHKPELDRIGFQELIGEWMVGADTLVNGTNGQGTQKSYAMQPAWEHYMTAFNECHGDFADEQQAMYMTLNRRYEVEANQSGGISIKDFTSYIDPTKYNYAFADTTIESQNFWTQIGMDIKVRRVMSSKVMPNL